MKKLSLFSVSSVVLSVSPTLMLRRLLLPFVPIFILLVALTACDASPGNAGGGGSSRSSSSVSSSSASVDSSDSSSLSSSQTSSSSSSSRNASSVSSSRSSSVASSSSSTGAQAYEGPGCMIGGCSNQICSNEDDEPVITNCMWTEAYACYRTARCEMQTGGSCGWTQNSDLTQCLADAS